MDSLKDFLTPKTFNKVSFVIVSCWMLFGVIFIGVFAEMEANGAFRCAVESERADLIQEKCFEQYQKRYNKMNIPVYGFVIVNFSAIVIVSAVYSQLVNSKVNELEARSADTEIQEQLKGRRLFAAYVFQLATRLALGIIFIALQILVLYPDKFPSKFKCKLPIQTSGGKNGKTSVVLSYECLNQQATKKSFWTDAVSVVNGIFAILVLIEITYILSRARKRKQFMQGSQFLADHLKSREKTDQQQVAGYIKRLKKRIIKETEDLRDLRSPFLPPPGERSKPKHLTLDQIYTNLVIKDGRAEYHFSGRRNEQLKEYPKSNENLPSTELGDIFDLRNKRIIIVGRPGIGKTLFCTKFLRDWASGSALTHFDVAFVYKFRKFNSPENLNLRELIQNRSEYSHKKMTDDVWNHIVENTARVLLIFDGLDEFADKSRIANDSSDCSDSFEEKMPFSALYNKLVSGKFLPGATVLTTSRPTAVSSVAHVNFNKTVEILGFTFEQVKEYVERFAKDDVSAGEKIWDHISSNLNIFTLCYIPVNCFIVCSCLLEVLNWEKSHGKVNSTGAVLPAKFTEIYKRAMKLFFYKHNKQFRYQDHTREEFESDDLPSQLQREFQRLGEIAFNGIKEGKLIFESNEVKGMEESDLFHRLPDRRTGPFRHEAQYCFIHLTMQEFLAAKHVVDTMKEDELRLFVSDHIVEGTWQVVLQFVAGLLGEQKQPSIEIFTDLLPFWVRRQTRLDDAEKAVLEPSTLIWWPSNEDKELELTVCKCIFEYKGSDAAVEQKFEKIGLNAVDFSGSSLAPVDCTSLVHVFKNVEGIVGMNLSHNHIDPLGCLEIGKLLTTTESKCNLNTLILAANVITDTGVKHLCHSLMNSDGKLRILDLSGNGITNEGVKHLSEALNDSNCTLSSLNLADNNITDAGVKHLYNSLTHGNSKLTSLNLYNNKITDKGVEHLAEALAHSNCKLSNLDLRANRINVKGVKHLSIAITSSNCKLSSLDLRGNEVGNEGVEHLIEAIKCRNVKLKSLNLAASRICINDDLSKKLTDVLTSRKCKLLHLFLSGNFLTDEGRDRFRHASFVCKVQY